MIGWLYIAAIVAVCCLAAWLGAMGDMCELDEEERYLPPRYLGDDYTGSNRYRGDDL